MPDTPADDSTASDLLRLARGHRVVGLLHAGGGPFAARSWRDAAYGQALHSARCMAEAERVLARIEPVAGGVLLIKGPVLAGQAWPDPGLRAFDDLDLRCRWPAFPSLCSVLRDAGYLPEIADPRRFGHLWRFGWGVAFVHPEGYRIEANHRLFPLQYPVVAAVRRLGGDRVLPHRLDTRSVPAPSPAFHLLIACLHAVWHGGVRLAWLADIAGLLARHPGALDRAEAWTRAGGFAQRALHTGCAAAGRIFGPDVVRRGLPDAVEGAVAMFVEQINGGRVTSGARRALHRALLNPAERLVYALRRALIPGDGDFRRLNLPQGLHALYWPLRPVRVLADRMRR